MKYKYSKSLGFQEPPDGYTPEEIELESVISDLSIQAIYAKLPTTRMKFIVAAHFELGYSQELLAEMLGVKQPTLKEEIELIKLVLKGYKYKPRKFKDSVKSEDILSVFVNLFLPNKSSL